jgi:MraZ protein
MIILIIRAFVFGVVMLTGFAYNLIEETGRMFMPAKYCEDFDVNRNADDEGAFSPPAGKLRKDYAGKCVLVHGIDRCLYAYPVRNWELLIKELRTLPSDDDNIRDLLRHYVGTSTFCDIDKQGRLTIPQESRNYAGLTRDLTCVGMLDLLEIWDRAAHADSISGKDVKALSNYASKLKRERDARTAGGA